MKVEAKGLDKVQAQLLQMSKRASDVTIALKAGALDVKTTIVDAFRTSTDPATGTPWEPLKETTIARRRKGSSKPLVDTGKLRGSVVATVANKAQITVGTNVTYAAPHQFGASSKNIPQRRFLPTTDGVFWAGDAGSPAQKTAARVAERVRNYILTGKATVGGNGQR